MKFSLDYTIKVGEEVFTPKDIEADVDKFRERFADLSSVEGALVLTIDGEEFCGEWFDPILRLADQFISKLRWILAGDTETVAYRNSEHCFAFVPAGDSVELSFFIGDEMEIEDYVLEPTNVRLDQFAEGSLRTMKQLVALMEAVVPGACESNIDCKDLKVSLDEAQQAWKDYLLHQRR